jgi:hypothetical protein
MTPKGLRGATQPSSFPRSEVFLAHVHATHAALAHASTAAASRLKIVLGTMRFCSKPRVLCSQMISTARRARHVIGFASAHQFLKLGSTIIASVFEDRHASKLAGFDPAGCWF